MDWTKEIARGDGVEVVCWLFALILLFLLMLSTIEGETAWNATNSGDSPERNTLIHKL